MNLEIRLCNKGHGTYRFVNPAGVYFHLILSQARTLWHVFCQSLGCFHGWWNCPPNALKCRKRFNYCCGRAVIVVECTFGSPRETWLCMPNRNGSNTKVVPAVAAARCALWCLQGRVGGLYLNKWTQETSTFPWPYIIMKGKCAHWSHTKLGTAFRIPYWYLIPWNWGKVYQANQIMGSAFHII